MTARSFVSSIEETQLTLYTVRLFGGEYGVLTVRQFGIQHWSLDVQLSWGVVPVAIDALLFARNALIEVHSVKTVIVYATINGVRVECDETSTPESLLMQVRVGELLKELGPEKALCILKSAQGESSPED